MRRGIGGRGRPSYDHPQHSQQREKRTTMSVKKAEPGKTKIGWIGTGVMGRWMCEHAMKAGFAATVYNRSKDKARPLLDAGAEYADSPRAVAERPGVVCAIVGFPKDVREVFLGPEGALAGAKSGTILVDMTTS